MVEGADGPRMGEELQTLEELAPVWDAFREGRTAECPRGDGSPMALAVDAAAGAYRLVCTLCGNSSPWFECGPAGLRIRRPLGSSNATTLVDE